MFYAMVLAKNPDKAADIDAEAERRRERLGEIASAVASTGFDAEDEDFDNSPNAELEALLPYYNRVEDEALKVAKRYFTGRFVADFKGVAGQKHFEYKQHGHSYSCYVDIYVENDEEINIIEVKATTSSKYQEMEFSDGVRADKGGKKYPLFVKKDNIMKLNFAASLMTDKTLQNFNKKKGDLLGRYRDEGKYAHDLAFQRFVIENALSEAGDNRQVNYYLAVLNSEYVYDGALGPDGKCLYEMVGGQDVVTFMDMNDVTHSYQPIILGEVEQLEGYIAAPRPIDDATPVGKCCEWGKSTECLFWSHCFEHLRGVPQTNKANNYIHFRGFKQGDIKDKYELVNGGYCKFDDVPAGWLEKKSHLIQRDCYKQGTEYVDREKMLYWFDKLEYPIYHFDFETFPCPLPRYQGETPYRQSVFEFSLHIEREPGMCDKEKDNYIFLNEECFDDERRALAEAIVDRFEFNPDGSLKGTMLAQNTGFEIARLKELAVLFPEYSDKLLAICNKSADLIHLLNTNSAFYQGYGRDADVVNYYHRDLSGSYSIKKTLPVLVPELTYKGMDVGNGVQAYIAFLNYDSKEPTFGLKTKAERRAALKRYCQQDTWAMVEILRAVRAKVGI